MISCKKGHVKSYTYVHFGDACPHRALVETHPYHLKNKGKNLFRKEVYSANHLAPITSFQDKKFSHFLNIALGTRLFSKARYFIVLL